MKSLTEYLIYEKLNYTNKITKKICRAFGFTENEEFTDAIDKWVKDNNVNNVAFYVKDIKELDNLGMSKSVKSLYSDDKDIIKKITISLEDNATEFAKEGKTSFDTFSLTGNDYVLSFNSYDGSLFVINEK